MSLLADLCFKFQAHPEVLATEALALLLNQSVLSDALGRFLSMRLEMTHSIPTNLKFKTQDPSADGGRPDIVAVSPDGQPCLIIELKFWAALTENQPIAYLDRLVESKSGVLVFVAPASRHEVLWSELARRIIASGRLMTNTYRSGHDLQVAFVGGAPMALMSWRSVLGILSDAAAAAGGAHASDISQLSDLAARMDTDAFLPLRQDELSPRIGGRFWQFTEIVNDIVSRLLEEGVCLRARKSGGQGYYGAAMLLRNHWLYFEVSVWHWSQYAATPFWLVYTADSQSRWPTLNAALSSLAAEVPPRLLTGRYGETPMIPLHTPTGVEKHDVVAALCEQIRDVARRLPPDASAAPEPAPPPLQGGIL